MAIQSLYLFYMQLCLDFRFLYKKVLYYQVLYPLLFVTLFLIIYILITSINFGFLNICRLCIITIWSIIPRLILKILFFKVITLYLLNNPNFQSYNNQLLFLVILIQGIGCNRYLKIHFILVSFHQKMQQLVQLITIFNDLYYMLVYVLNLNRTQNNKIFYLIRKCFYMVFRSSQHIVLNLVQLIYTYQSRYFLDLNIIQERLQIDSIIQYLAIIHHFIYSQI